MAGKIIALPGMGADSRMFPLPWDLLPGFHPVDWSSAFEGRALEAVARRVCEVHAINDGDVVIGTSLGGIVACEIARRRQLSSLVLVGSATSKEEVNPIRRRTDPHPNIHTAKRKGRGATAGGLAYPVLTTPPRHEA